MESSQLQASQISDDIKLYTHAPQVFREILQESYSVPAVYKMLQHIARDVKAQVREENV